jgi:hypothetical protein
LIVADAADVSTVNEPGSESVELDAGMRLRPTAGSPLKAVSNAPVLVGKSVDSVIPMA